MAKKKKVQYVDYIVLVGSSDVEAKEIDRGLDRTSAMAAMVADQQRLRRLLQEKFSRVQVFDPTSPLPFLIYLRLPGKWSKTAKLAQRIAVAARGLVPSIACELAPINTKHPRGFIRKVPDA